MRRLGRDAWSMVKLRRQATNEYPPSLHPSKVEIYADHIALGEIIGSGSFAEVRKGRVLGAGVQERFEGATDRESKTIANLRRRGEKMGLRVGGGGMGVAVKVLRDVRRQTLKRFWSEVLIMKVGGFFGEGRGEGCVCTM